MKKTKKKRRIVLPLLLLVAVVAGGIYLFVLPFSTKDENVRIYIDRDDTKDSVMHKLQAAAPRQTIGLNIMAMLRGYSGNVRTGCYEITPSMSTYRLATNLSHGKHVPVRVTIPATWTKEMALARMSRQLMEDSAAFAAEFNNPAALKTYGVDTATAATLLLSDTYEIYWNTTPQQLIKRMAQERDRFWNAQRTAKAKALGMNKEEVYTLASIVDAETANNAEKPTVAGLYLNRLKKGMLLQADPTVKFALQDFGLRRIYGYMLTTPSPYNTYLHKGLPPGPIRVPQTSSIDAVLNAATHDYLYMCANSDFSGTHAFAATYSEHLRNAARYVRALNERGIK